MTIIKNNKAFISIIFCVCITLLLSGCSAKKEKVLSKKQFTQIRVKKHSIQYFLNGNRLLKQKKYRHAIKQYDAAIKLDPTQSSFHYNKGLSEFYLRLYQKSAFSFKGALKQNQYLPQAWYNLALAYHRLNDSENALIAYENYKRINKK